MTWRTRSAAVLTLVASVVLVHSGRAGALTVQTIARFTEAPTALVVRDIDGDHVDDLLAASGCTLHVLPGKAAGGFAAPVDHALPHGIQPCGGVASLAVGDVDDDGHLDVVVARELFSSSVVVLRGQSDGTLADPTAVGSDSYQHDVALGDLNGDGRDDVITLTGTFVNVILADPGGGFTPSHLYQQAYQLGTSVTTGRFDADSDVDVAVGVGEYCASMAPDCTHRNGVLVYRGNGDGTLGSLVFENGWALTSARFVATATRHPATGNLLMPPAQILTTRLRNLTWDDMVVTSPLVQTVLPATDGALTAPAPAFDAGGLGDFGDFDRDGATDVGLAGYSDSAYASLLLGDGDAGFDVALFYDFDGGSPLNAQVADINHDAWPDLIVASSGTVYAALNTPTAGSDPWYLDFGELGTGMQSAPRRVDVVNVGTQGLKVGSASLAGPQASDFRIASNGCANAQLGILDACPITVTFRAGAEGEREAELRVASSDPDGPLSIPLYGAGATPPASGGTPPPAPVTLPDSTAPSLKSKVARQRLGTVLKRGLEVKVGCSEACRVTLRAIVARRQAKALHLRAPARGLVVGKATVMQDHAGSRTVLVRLSRRLRRAARGAHRLTLRLEAVASDAAGNRSATLRQTARLARG